MFISFFPNNVISNGSGLYEMNGLFKFLTKPSCDIEDKIQKGKFYLKYNIFHAINKI